MICRVFNSQTDLDAANARWVAARAAAGVHDLLCGVPLEPEVTERWSCGVTLPDGRIACPVPDRWAAEFGGDEIEADEVNQ